MARPLARTAHQVREHSLGPAPAYEVACPDTSPRTATSTSTLVPSSLFTPRVAALLDVHKFWHPWLFGSRLLSIAPAATSLWQLVEHGVGFVAGNGEGGPVQDIRGAFPVTETCLAVIWCFAAGYLSFFFTDCLMSRWLLHYTPPATVIRLLAIAVSNAFITQKLLSLTGGLDDFRLLLPGWVGISTILTILYHITQRKINIRKETSTSINVFSIASFLSMVSLLAHLYSGRSDYPQIPLFSLGKRVWEFVLGHGVQSNARPREL